MVFEGHINSDCIFTIVWDDWQRQRSDLPSKTLSKTVRTPIAKAIWGILYDIIYYMLYIIYYILYTIYYILYIICYMLYVICYILYTIHYILYII